MFKAIFLERDGTGTQARVADLDEAQLPDCEVTVKIDYSTINYQDGLAITGKAPVVRHWPMVPGIDFSGCVLKSRDPRFSPGDMVVLNGWGVGETHWGGLAQLASVPADYLIKLPDGLSSRDAMAIGTAGYTAMLAIQALERAGVTPESGDVLVTGANGGVGSFAVALLAKRKYRVIASTGRPQESERLFALGAAQVIDRKTLSEAGKPLQKERWAAAIDSVGSYTLANVCASVKYGGVVAACGLAQGMDFPATVAPFILRGITLAGIDSVMAPLLTRQAAWAALALEVDAGMISAISHEISLSDVIPMAHALMEGEVKGRIVVNPNLV